MSTSNILQKIPVLMLVALFIQVTSAATDCYLFGKSVQLRKVKDVEDGSVEIHAQNVILDKNIVGWFDLKRCLNSLRGLSSKQENIDDEITAKLVIAIKNVETALERYRIESKQLIAPVLVSIFCGISLDVENGKHLVKTTNNNDLIPEIFKDSFTKGVEILVCPDRPVDKVLLVSAFGSSAVTSDYDFNLFIVDLQAIADIERDLHNHFVSIRQITMDDKETDLDVDNRVILNKDTLVLKDNKNIYFKFARMMMATFSDVSAMVERVYIEFEKLIPFVKIIEGAAGYANPDNFQVTAFDKDLTKYKVGMQIGKNQLSCTGLANCYDSNAYPDTMALNKLLFRLPLHLLDGGPSKSMLGFTATDINSLNTEYMTLSVNSLCDYSMLPLNRSKNEFVKGHRDMLENDCNIAIRNATTQEVKNNQHKHIGIKILADELDLITKDKPEHKTFPSCLERNSPKNRGLEAVANKIYNFHQIFYLSHIIAICTMWLDEGYFTFGALEHFKFGGNKAITLQNFSYAESFSENFSMLAIHYEDKIKPDAKLDQGMSDMYSKYFMRAFGATSKMFEELKVPTPDNGFYHKFNAEHLNHFVLDNDTLSIYISGHADLIKFSEKSIIFTTQPADPNLKTDPRNFEKETKIRHIFGSCTNLYFLFFDQISSLMENKALQDFNVKDVYYANDDQKKELFYDRFHAFTSSRDDKLSCPEFETLDELLAYTHIIVRTSELYMYANLKNHIGKYQMKIDDFVKSSSDLISRLFIEHQRKIAQRKREDEEHLLAALMSHRHEPKGRRNAIKGMSQRDAITLANKLKEFIKNDQLLNPPIFPGSHEQAKDKLKKHNKDSVSDSDSDEDGASGASALVEIGSNENRNEVLNFSHCENDKIDEEESRRIQKALNPEFIEDNEYTQKINDNDVAVTKDANFELRKSPIYDVYEARQQLRRKSLPVYNNNVLVKNIGFVYDPITGNILDYNGGKNMLKDDKTPDLYEDDYKSPDLDEDDYKSPLSNDPKNQIKDLKSSKKDADDNISTASTDVIPSQNSATDDANVLDRNLSHAETVSESLLRQRMIAGESRRLLLI